MQLPPTPPVDKTQQKGYATPPNASNPLTPDTTPTKSSRAPPDQGVHQSTNLHAETIRTVREGLSCPDNNEKQKSEKTAAMSVNDGSAACIPDKEMKSTRHMQGSSPSPSPEQSPNSQVHLLRIRKKRQQIPSRTQTELMTPLTSKGPSKSADWTSDNDRLYKQIRHRNMDRIEALEEGSAIEAVVSTTDAIRKPSLRHVKKRHSLRMGSTGSSASAEKEDVPNAGDRRVSPLRHKKAFASSQQEHDLVLAPSYALAAASARTLRHERRPLSADGRPERSARSAMTDVADGRRYVSLPLHLRSVSSTDEQHSLRRVSKNKRLENVSLPDTVEGAHATSDEPTVSNLSPSIRSHRFANTQTPMSGISDRTEMELCEAKNVTLFSHSNDSVLLINSGNLTAKTSALTTQQLAPRTFRPLSFTFEDPESSSSTSSDSLSRSLSTPEIQVNGHTHNGVDSPLTNPRVAPLPPAINFIPPTPSIDDERQAVHQSESTATAVVQRSGSLLRTARRLSDTILTPLFSRSNSYRRSDRTPQITTAANNSLHPMWTPTSMWDDDDYTDEEDYDDEDYNNRLPAGGDTSGHPTQQSRSLFPRQMSVRMPGFRGTGGFLLGNSLGVERHGTNKRRHHVELPDKRDQHNHITFLQSVRRRVKDMRASREEVAREKRRAELKESIGLRLVHNV